VRGFIDNARASVNLPNARWKVFGDPLISEMRMRMHRMAEDIIRMSIEQSKSPNICLEQIRNAMLRA